jgi:hypothetical protein
MAEVLMCRTSLFNLLGVATMSNATLETILTQHAIPLTYWREMRALVFDGARPSKALLRRLRNVGNYAAALNSILIELSKQVKHKFPPRKWKPSSSRKAS